MNKIQSALEILQSRIAHCAASCGRTVDEIRWVAISKYATIEQIQQAYDCGIRVFGESKVLEALTKKSLLPRDVEWHFIGRIQSNKISKMIGQFSLIHSVADVQVAKTLSVKSLEHGCIQPVLLQVNVVGDPHKQGFLPEQILVLWDELSSLAGIAIKGLMTIGPHTDNKQSITSCFHGLAQLRHRLQSKGAVITELSMGMSQDFDIAIEQNATWLRIGSTLFSSSIQ